MEVAVSSRPKARWLILHVVLVCAMVAWAEDIPKERLDHEYQKAVEEYNAGEYAAAAKLLEPLLPYAEKSFEVHELIGLVYASMSEDAKAIDHLKLAVQLQPDSTAARINLGTSLLHSGRAALAVEQFRKALQMDPQSFDANHNLGEVYIQSGRVADAQPLLAKAQQIDPTSYGNGYDLAMADFLLGRLDEARQAAQSLVKIQDTGEVHNLLGQIDEKDGKFLAAANDYETAAHLDPSEGNLFDWGCEMLLHRTYEPAITIFEQGAKRYPNSPRILIGLGLALYSRGKYDEAVKALMAAADLTPRDPRCYLFLSRAYDSSPTQASAVLDRFRRYAELEPENALAQYYYAISLWKGKRTGASNVDLTMVESLLKKAIALNESLPEAHVQLGDLYADQHEWEKSIPEYERALALNANLSDAHYRLGTDYVHVGQRDKAQKEFAIYQELRAQHLAEVDKERAEVKQFVYASRDASATKP
jgi:tetratricopeptide (TPR) repeat protein